MRIAMRFVLAFLCVSAMLCAQTPVEPRFALEISEDGTMTRYQIVPESGKVSLSTFLDPALHQLAGQDTGNIEKPKPSTVLLVCNVEGNAVAVSASVVFGAIDQSDSDAFLRSNPKQQLGNYSLHLGESMELQEMEQFGLQPWTIRIVNAQLTDQGTLPIVSNVPSIQPGILGRDREGYRIGLRNTSSQAVTAFAVETTVDHTSVTSESNNPGFLIAPGAIHEFGLPCDSSASATSSGVGLNAAVCVFYLQAALFADGSYEGDARQAAELAARPLAAQFQKKRVRELIESIVADPTLDDASKLARIRAELPKLPEKDDPELQELLRIRFPSLSAREWASVDRTTKGTLASEKGNALRDLKQFENLSKQGDFSKSLAQWWSARIANE